MAKNSRHTNPTKEPDFLITSLIGGAVGIVIALLLILVSPLILIKTANPNSLSEIAAYLSLFIGGFTASLLTSKNFKKSVLQSGLTVGAVMALVLIPISLFIPGDFNIIGALITVMIIFGSAFLGAFIIFKINTDGKRNMKKALKRR